MQHTQIKNMNYTSIDDFYYCKPLIEMKLKNFNMKFNIEEKVSTIVDVFKEDITNRYLAYGAEFKADENLFTKVTGYTPNLITNNAERLLDIIKKIQAINTNKKKNISFRIRIHDDRVIYYEITETDDRDDYKGICYHITIMDFDGKLKVCTINILNVYKDKNNKPECSVNVITPIYLATKERYIKDMMGREENFHLISSLSFSQNAYEALKFVYDKIKTVTDPNQYSIYYDHTNFEISLINRITNKDCLREDVTFDISFGAWQITDNDMKYQSFRMLATMKEHIPYCVIDPSKESPLVDFTKREIEYMHKYIDNKNFMGKDDGTINLAEVLNTARYGKNLIFQSTLEGKPLMCYVTYEYNEKVDAVMFYNTIFIRNDMIVYIAYYFEKCKNFNFTNNFIGMQLNLAFITPFRLSKNRDEMRSIVPIQFLDSAKLSSNIYDVISVYVMIHDRPERNRVIKSTETIKVLSSNRPNKDNKNNKKKGNKKEKEEVTVRRILKTATSAKKFIKEKMAEAEATGEKGERIERIYTLEEWERKEHTRRNPWTGELITIKATTCHRKLKITKDKEIHLKL